MERHTVVDTVTCLAAHSLSNLGRLPITCAAPPTTEARGRWPMSPLFPRDALGAWQPGAATQLLLPTAANLD